MIVGKKVATPPIRNRMPEKNKLYQSLQQPQTGPSTQPQKKGSRKATHDIIPDDLKEFIYVHFNEGVRDEKILSAFWRQEEF